MRIFYFKLSKKSIFSLCFTHKNIFTIDKMAYQKINSFFLFFLWKKKSQEKKNMSTE